MNHRVAFEPRKSWIKVQYRLWFIPCFRVLQYCLIPFICLSYTILFCEYLSTANVRPLLPYLWIYIHFFHFTLVWTINHCLFGGHILKVYNAETIWLLYCMWLLFKRKYNFLLIPFKYAVLDLLKNEYGAHRTLHTDQ